MKKTLIQKLVLYTAHVVASLTFTASTTIFAESPTALDTHHASLHPSLTTHEKDKKSSPSFISTQASQATLTPEAALARLQTGNTRFVTDNAIDHDHLQAASITSTNGQFPLAIILGCIDSRSIANIIFNKELGNIFTTNTAGNVASATILGGMEYAVNYAGAKLIVVMGHTQCGAITAACKGGQYSDHLSTLLDKIKPAVSMIQTKKGDIDCNNANTINAIAKQNVLNQIQNILEKSPTIASLSTQHTIAVIGAMHDISTGKVDFFDPTGQTINASNASFIKPSASVE